MRAHLSKQGHQIALGETIIYMSKFLGDSAGGKKEKCLPPPPSPHPKCSYKPSGCWRREAVVSTRQLVLLPRGTGSDLILPANVVRGPLHLPQNSSELLIGPSELIKR